METFEKKHSIVLTEVFNSREDLNNHERDCVHFKASYLAIVSALLNTDLNGAFVRGNFDTFCPETQFVRLDALDETDWPHNISDNSIFVEFKINLREHSVEVFRCGHIYLTEHDQKASYLCMCSMKKAHIANGGKWMRKNRFSDASELARKIQKFWLSIAETLNKVTDGYPYKQMTRNIY
jgi:hypothetical protein